MVVIVDYGLGNVRSVFSKVQRMQPDSKVSSEPKDLLSASKLILPGVGSFSEGIKRIKQRDLLMALNEAVIGKKTPILGICLGMQLFAESSEEGHADGLGWVKGKVLKFHFPNQKIAVPQVGWNSVEIRDKNLIIFKEIESNSYFYFTHSYYFKCENEDDVAGKTQYGDLKFASSISKDNIFGTQFHPEKSHQNGMKLISNFLKG